MVKEKFYIEVEADSICIASDKLNGLKLEAETIQQAIEFAQSTSSRGAEIEYELKSLIPQAWSSDDTDEYFAKRNLTHRMQL